MLLEKIYINSLFYFGMANAWVDRILGIFLVLAALAPILSIEGLDYGLAIWSPWAYVILGVFIWMAAPRVSVGGPKKKLYVFFAWAVLILGVLSVLEFVGLFFSGFSQIISFAILILGMWMIIAPSA